MRKESGVPKGHARALNDTLKKPTPRSKLRGIYGFLPFGTGCRPTRCFLKTLQQATGNDQVQMLSFGSDWESARESYRMAIFGKGSLPRQSGQPYIDPQTADAVLENRGKLSFPELLRCRVRYFSDGAVLGSNEFVQEQFEAFRQYLSEQRKSGPRRMRGGD